MLYYFKKATLLCLLLWGNHLSAQEKSHEYIFEVNPQWYSYENYVIEGPLGVLKAFDFIEKEQYFAKPSILFGLSDNTSVRLGSFFSYTNFNEFDNKMEASPYLGLNYYHTFDGSFKKFSFSTYLRAEKRYFYFENDRESEDSTRIRLRLRGFYQLNSRLEAHSWQRVILGAEILRSYDNNIDYTQFQENFKVESRITFAIDRTLEKNQKIRFETTWKYQVPINEILNRNVSTVRFMIRYYPSWGNLFDIHLFNAAGE